MRVIINGRIFEGVDLADCMWENLKSLGYPTDPESEKRGREVARQVAEKHGPNE